MITKKLKKQMEAYAKENSKRMTREKTNEELLTQVMEWQRETYGEAFEDTEILHYKGGVEDAIWLLQTMPGMFPWGYNPFFGPPIIARFKRSGKQGSYFITEIAMDAWEWDRNATIDKILND
jgi:hypothetical protein